MSQPIDKDPEFIALRALSSALGRDPSRTQAAGGNTSLKHDGVLWIKASGTWLAHAEERDIMVPVDLNGLLDALAADDPRAETAASFVDEARNPVRLRPSIETSVHAVIPHAVVAHIHCVETIALAVRADGEALIAERLGSLGDVAWIYVSYLRPGLPLSKVIAARSAPSVNVIILANHGLVVAGATVMEVADRLDRVCHALASPARSAPSPDLSRLAQAIEGSDYRLPADAAAHGLALDSASLSLARGGSLYPDHVIFLGPGIVVAPNVDAGAAARPAGARDGPPPMVTIPGLGIVMHRSATNAADALARCLADVVSRIPPGAEIVRLTPLQEYELTHWEAEKYRQALDARTSKQGEAPAP
ncbi:class II aldolase/adducin family protein [Methylocapsa sp. S129]|uniref:class II aldolase/adducin family protein n=1 Tax=Methylocapsa sp. S129 TaxID=1641869 RepID=UPI00131CED18|nr:class II aldolase/adducin family protein [Methylocapsa sp. S129]